MARLTASLRLVPILAVLLSACRGPTPSVAGPTPTASPAPASAASATPSPPPAEDILYLSLIWHHHQPLYYKDEQGVYSRPWVRVHGTKDYYDMAATVANFPAVRVTFNLTPVLLRQIDDFVTNGARDRYWALAAKPAADLTTDEKDFLLRRFFDANWEHVIGVHPGYRALLEKRGGSSDEAIAEAMASFTEQNYRDLQIWFNLAWFDPDFLASEPLRSLVVKDRGFAEADKAIVFDQVRRVMADIVPIYRRLQAAGQIEVTTTPYAHPILPLINDTAIATLGSPSGEQPRRFTYPADAEAHLARSAEIYQETFGRRPRGLWPGEGAVSQPIVSLVAAAGYEWMASGEPVLAKSLGIEQFTRDSNDTVQQADQLYRPYYVQAPGGDPVLMVFRDLALSDKIGFTYSGTPGEQAAADFMQRLENIRARLKEEGAGGPHLVTVILDGENAWEHYDNDGKEFLHALYRRLSESTTVKTVTPSEYRALFPDQRRITYLFPGAWFSANYDTWIGEPQETQAWNYLFQVRADLAQYDLYKKRTPPSPAALAQALDYMYLAEGSDWFWWYGSDQNSGDDSYFDQAYRALLANVYRSLGEPIPSFVNVPIIPAAAAAPARPLGGLLTPRIDGRADPDEWTLAAYYAAAEGPQTGSSNVAAGLYYGVDAEYLYVRVEGGSDWRALDDATVGLYLSAPRFADAVASTRLSAGSAAPTWLGFGANALAEVHVIGGGYTGAVYLARGEDWAPAETLEAIGAQGTTLEFRMPLAVLGDIEPGDDLRLAVVVSRGSEDVQRLPAEGPGQLIVPDLGTTTTVLSVDDPQGDDHGPGTYRYPTDGVFAPGVFDLKSFSVGYDEKTLVFKFAFYGPVSNPWGSPNHLALQTLDVYVDKDPGAGTGARLLLPGRNAALAAGTGWEYAVWAEGWTPQFLAPGEAGGEPTQVTTVNYKIIVNPVSATVTLRVPRSAFGPGDPASWGYVAVVLSQEGFPSPGVWRVRDGQEVAAQWRFGGVPAGLTNYPRIFDLADTGDQAAQLDYRPATAEVGSLPPDGFAQLALLKPRP